jgi:predicted phage-related endonuclease
MLDNSFGDLVFERAGLVQEIKTRTDRKKLIEADLKFALGNATVGVLEDGRVITWKPDKNGRRNLRVGGEE